MTLTIKIVLLRIVIAALSLLLSFWWLGRGYLADDFGLLTTVQQMGYTDVEPFSPEDKHVLTAPLVCSDFSAVAYDLRVINSDGLPVEITVCCGWPSELCSVRYPR